MYAVRWHVTGRVRGFAKRSRAAVAVLLLLLLAAPALGTQRDEGTVLAPEFIANDGTPVVIYFELPGHQPGETYAVKAYLRGDTRHRQPSEVYSTMVDGWIKARAAWADQPRFEACGEGRLRGWLAIRSTESRPDVVEEVTRNPLEVRVQGPIRVDGDSIHTGRSFDPVPIDGVELTTEPLTLVEWEVPEYPGQLISLEDRDGTLLGQYVAKPNGIQDGYRVIPGLVRMRAPLGGPYRLVARDAQTGEVLEHVDEEVCVRAPRTLTILHTNDLHSALEPLPYLAAYVRRVREESDQVLLLDAGDMFSGAPENDLLEGKPIIDLMNQLGYDAVVVGNHEFDYGQEALEARIAEAAFPWLLANVDIAEPEATPLTGFAPYTLIEIDEELTVGIIGLLYEMPYTECDTLQGLAFHDPITTAETLMAELQGRSDLHIALTHMGYDLDRELAQRVPQLDVIVGGHEHANRYEEINGVHFVRADSDARSIGHLELALSDAGRVLEVSARIVASSELRDQGTVDEVLQQRAIEWRELAEQEFGLDERIGRSARDIERYRGHSWPVGHLVTDALRHHTGADIAIWNNGGIRAEVPSGVIQKRHAYLTLPFAEPLWTVELTGRAMHELISFSYTREGRNRVDLQVSGMAYTIERDPDTRDLISAELFVDRQPMDPEARYLVAVSQFLLEGGSGYPFPQYLEDGRAQNPQRFSSEHPALLLARFIEYKGDISAYARWAPRITVLDEQ